LRIVCIHSVHCEVFGSRGVPHRAAGKEPASTLDSSWSTDVNVDQADARTSPISKELAALQVTAAIGRLGRPP
jgi:hypothetical protein